MHTGPQEHNHIANTKKPSRLVQRRKKTLDMQLAKQLSEKYVIEAAVQKFMNSHASGDSRIVNNDSNTVYISITASKYVFILTKTNNNISVDFTWLSQPKNILPVTNEILECLIDHFGTTIYGHQVYGFTELKKENKSIVQTSIIKIRGPGMTMLSLHGNQTKN